MVSENVRTVRFFANQDAEDLYRCKENGRVYIRQPCDNDYVRWLTSCKWTGGYEADCPMKEGLKLHVVDKNGEILHRENLIVVDGYCWTVAEKNAPFSYEAIKRFELDIRKELSLKTYEEWKAWLMKEAAAAGYTGEYHGWCYDTDGGKPLKDRKVSYLGKDAWLVHTTQVHCQCRKAWTVYEILTADMSTSLALVGYKLYGEEA